MRKDRCERAKQMISFRHWLLKHNRRRLHPAAYYKTAGTQRTTLRFPRCRREDEIGLRIISSGFTMVEMIIVVIIIAISAAIVIPMMGSAASMQIRSAANMIAADLEYAKSMAISRGQNFTVVFDKAAESYSIKDQSGSIIAHPVKKGFNYVIDFRNDRRLNEVDIEEVDFDSGSHPEITFDCLGSPYSGIGTATPLDPADPGQIKLKAGNFNIFIKVEPITGFISISD